MARDRNRHAHQGVATLAHTDQDPGRGVGAVPWVALIIALARHPALWATAALQVLAVAPTGWWRRRPYLPRPDGAYVAFRIRTQHGEAGAATLDPEDVIRYLEWCRALR